MKSSLERLSRSHYKEKTATHVNPVPCVFPVDTRSVILHATYCARGILGFQRIVTVECHVSKQVRGVIQSDEPLLLCCSVREAQSRIPARLPVDTFSFIPHPADSVPLLFPVTPNVLEKTKVIPAYIRHFGLLNYCNVDSFLMVF